MLGRTKSDPLDITWDVTYTVGLEFLIDEGTGKASTMWTMSTNHVDAYKLLHTRSLWPWHGYQACRSWLRDPHMPWQPSACLNIAGNENTTGSNLIGSSTRNELMTEVRLVLGGGLVLDPFAINTTSQKTSSLNCNPEIPYGHRRTNP